jgi:hypothetical protein
MKTEHLTYAFLKMYFQQEKLPKELFIEHKNVLIKDVKRVTDGYILAIENLIKLGVDLSRNRYAESCKYWLETIYKEIRKPKQIDLQ